MTDLVCQQPVAVADWMMLMLIIGLVVGWAARAVSDRQVARSPDAGKDESRG